MEVTGICASTAARITTGSVRQFKNDHMAPSCLRSPSTILYHELNQLELFIMSAQPPDFDAMLPADTAPMTYGGSVTTSST